MITGKDTEPYAIRTDLGWSVAEHPHTDEDWTSQCCRVAVKEMPGLGDLEIEVKVTVTSRSSEGSHNNLPPKFEAYCAGSLDGKSHMVK